MFGREGGGGKGGNGELGKETKNGAVHSEQGASKGRGFATMYKEPPFQVRVLFLKLNIHKHDPCDNCARQKNVGPASPFNPMA
jgi:hypothetical protein